MHAKRTNEKFPRSLKQRADAVRKHNVRGDYFKGGEYHRCRFCNTDIQGLFYQPNPRDPSKTIAKLRPLGNYCMWEIKLVSGSIMSVNSCLDCFRIFDVHDKEKLEAVLASNYEGWIRNCSNESSVIRDLENVFISEEAVPGHKKLFRKFSS